MIDIDSRGAHGHDRRRDPVRRPGARCSNDPASALHNLASLPHISVAGACATATHGSGDRLGNLAPPSWRYELVRADGELVALSRDGDGETFPASVVSLGALGVVTRLTLAVEPSYRVRQDVYEGLPIAALREHFDELTASGDSVSLFTEVARPA